MVVEIFEVVVGGFRSFLLLVLTGKKYVAENLAGNFLLHVIWWNFPIQ